jgi:hypothetical protein
VRSSPLEEPFLRTGPGAQDSSGIVIEITVDSLPSLARRPEGSEIFDSAALYAGKHACRDQCSSPEIAIID